MKKENLIPTETVNPRTKKLDVSSPRQIVRMINAEDFNAARAVQKAGPAIAKAVDLAAKTFLAGHKIIFIGHTILFHHLSSTILKINHLIQMSRH